MPNTEEFSHLQKHAKIKDIETLQKKTKKQVHYNVNEDVSLEQYLR